MCAIIFGDGERFNAQLAQPAGSEGLNSAIHEPSNSKGKVYLKIKNRRGVSSSLWLYGFEIHPSALVGKFEF